jgi:hypothetical protein
MMKLALKIQKKHPMWGQLAEQNWNSCLPFLENSRALLIHRPMRVGTYRCGNRPMHLGIHFWCGNSAVGNKKFTFLPVPPENSLLCELCEKNAVAAGLPSAESLAGRHVHIGKLKAIRLCCSGETVSVPKTSTITNDNKEVI